jgi:hypothetical protein
MWIITQISNQILIKCYRKVVSDLLNNFLLIMEGDFLWLKWSNYALKLQTGKTRVRDVIKNMNNSTSTQPILMRLYTNVVFDLLNNFLLIMEGDFLWLKWSNYALKLQNGKTQVCDVIKNMNNFTSTQLILMRLYKKCSFWPAEQFSLNNGRRFPLTKVAKLRSDVTKWSMTL